MGNCEVCENEYENTFKVIMGGQTHEFDCFECAVHALAPRCYRCGCKVLGHGAERGGVIFCGSHCARVAGINILEDRPSVTTYL